MRKKRLIKRLKKCINDRIIDWFFKKWAYNMI